MNKIFNKLHSILDVDNRDYKYIISVDYEMTNDCGNPISHFYIFRCEQYGWLSSLIFEEEFIEPVYYDCVHTILSLLDIFQQYNANIDIFLINSIGLNYSIYYNVDKILKSNYFNIHKDNMIYQALCHPDNIDKHNYTKHILYDNNFQGNIFPMFDLEQEDIDIHKITTFNNLRVVDDYHNLPINWTDFINNYQKGNKGYMLFVGLIFVVLYQSQRIRIT